MKITWGNIHTLVTKDMEKSIEDSMIARFWNELWRRMSETWLSVIAIFDVDILAQGWDRWPSYLSGKRKKKPKTSQKQKTPLITEPHPIS